MVKILSVYNGHTASAAYVKDGEVISALSEERFTGVKNYQGFPKNSIDEILKTNDLKGEDFDYLVFPQLQTSPKFSPIEQSQQTPTMRVIKTIYYPFNLFRTFFGYLTYKFPILIPVRVWAHNLLINTVGIFSAHSEEKFVAKTLGVDPSKIISYNHHLAHAASAYYSSPFSSDKCLVLTLDGEGDGICGSVNVFDGKNYETIATTSRENSIGLIYMYVTGYLGMKMGEHEYKVMGLAPYAKEDSVNKLYKKIKDLVTLDPNNKLRFKTKIHASETLRYLNDNMKGARFDNIAGAFQKLTEEVVTEWVSEAIRVTGIKKLCLAGGVFMNVKLNQKIMLMPQVDAVYVMPSCGDETSIFGAAYLTEAKYNPNFTPKSLRKMVLGSEFSDDQVKTFLDEHKVSQKYSVEFIEDIELKIAQLLSQNKVVGRAKGKMEFGARALGNRSILANASDQDVVMIINEQMKDRDFWMPFAPSIMAERANDYINNPKNNDPLFMIMAFDSTALAKKELRAGLHPYDFTCRPQIVHKQDNPEYHKIISEFEKLTGIGGVLNTSFNLHGFPIVRNPNDAFYAFEHSGLEYLALGNFLISKK